jgi:hypothetical protein
VLLQLSAVAALELIIQEQGLMVEHQALVLIVLREAGMELIDKINIVVELVELAQVAT